MREVAARASGAAVQDPAPGPLLAQPKQATLPAAGNARIEKYHNAGVLCWSGNDDEAHAGRHQHHAQVGAAPAAVEAVSALQPAPAVPGSSALPTRLPTPANRPAQGVISVTSNVIPGLMSKLMSEARAHA